MIGWSLTAYGDEMLEKSVHEAKISALHALYARQRKLAAKIDQLEDELGLLAWKGHPKHPYSNKIVHRLLMLDRATRAQHIKAMAEKSGVSKRVFYYRLSKCPGWKLRALEIHK